MSNKVKKAHSDLRRLLNKYPNADSAINDIANGMSISNSLATHFPCELSDEEYKELLKAEDERLN